MSKRNSYCQKLRDWRDSYRKAEHATYVQYMQDLFCLVLNDPEIMGKDVLGEKRMTKVVAAVWDAYDKYYDAVQPVVSPEADYQQAKMDEQLKRIFKKSFQPFPERYQYLKQPK